MRFLRIPTAHTALQELEPLKTLWIPHHVYQELQDEAGKWQPLETGGILLGYWDDALTEVVVTHAVGPGPNAVHERYQFFPDVEFHINETARVYKQSGRRFGYLGDWHTHPGAPGYLSRRDLKTLKRIALNPASRASCPIMMIMGDGPEWEPVVWLGHITARPWRYRHLEIEKMQLSFYFCPS